MVLFFRRVGSLPTEQSRKKFAKKGWDGKIGNAMARTAALQVPPQSSPYAANNSKSTSASQAESRPCYMSRRFIHHNASRRKIYGYLHTRRIREWPGSLDWRKAADSYNRPQCPASGTYLCAFEAGYGRVKPNVGKWLVKSSASCSLCESKVTQLR